MLIVSKRTERASFMAPTVDRFSNLPKNVTEAILMRLPLRDAVRTSILSRSWRYEWNTIPQLVFDEDCVPYHESKSFELYDKKFVEIVNQVLLLHNGPIRKLELTIKVEKGRDIDRWILFASRNGIKEFTLVKWAVDYYKVPSCLYLCEDLTYLRLYGCSITPPSSFRGFSSLTTLSLEDVTFPNNGLEILISICPLLTKLVLEDIYGCDHLNICALKLVDLKIIDGFEEICFENTPLLAILSIHLSVELDRAVSDGTICKLAQVLGRLPKIERLELSGQALPIFLEGGFLFKLPPAHQLKYLTIDLDFEDMRQMLAIRCIFRSSPFLQELYIKASSSDNYDTEIFLDHVWAAHKAFDRLFSRLRIVEVKNFTGTKSEMKFVEFVLASAPVLETLQIELRQDTAEALNTLKEMINFRRVSARGKIVFPA